MLYRYSKSSEEVDGGEVIYPLLWLRIPNYMAGGKVQDIQYVPNFYYD